ncbi:MAG: hypothetical protein WC729_29395 [Sphingomonas sp.]|jgi:hypothetical protein|uniref:hypothetical protein n=1 Tax=Sphingomonas sp. TaxID=28214 RepID=UPI003568DC30
MKIIPRLLSLVVASLLTYVCFVSLAFAAEAVVLPASSGIDWTKVVMGIIGALLPLLITGLTWVSKKLADLIGQKVKNEEVKGILARLDEIVFNVVKELMQTTVDAAKKKADEGGLPKEVADAAGKAALDKIKSYLGSEGLKLLGMVLGITDDAKLDEYLKTKIESTVHTVKLQRDASVSAGAATAALTSAFGIVK